MSQTTELARVHGKHRGRSDRACSCCCPLIQATCSPLGDTCNFSPGPRNGVEPKRGFHSGEVPKHDLHRADKWRIQTFILVLTVGLDAAVLGADLGPRTLKLPWSSSALKRLSKDSAKQLKTFIKFCEKPQNFKQAVLCVLSPWDFSIREMSLHSISADCTKPYMRRRIRHVH